MMGEQNVVFFSLEMGAEQLIQRLISIHTGIELSIIRSGQLSQTQWDQYNKQVNDLMGDNLTIIDDVYTLTNICTRCKKLRMQKKMGVVFIDYLQLIIHKVDSGRSKANEVSEISRALKMLAKGLNIPVIALSQLNRSCESRADKKPLLSDLRESGSIEQDADIVEMIYRPEYYAEIKDADTNGELTGRAWILIQKNRHGSTRDVEFDFNAECTKFENTNKNHHNQTPF
jgi:replicative DNA helicase